MPDSRVTSLHALCVYAEPLAARRRVIVVADASLGLDAQLVELGARTVHVYDPEPARARQYAASAARGASIRELPAFDFEVRDGAYDLALVPDLSTVSDRAGLLARLRRLVGAEGAALVGARASGIDYYELYDLVSLQFANVRMIGQVPFSGVAIAELGESDEEPSVSVDTQLLTEAEPPDAFVALASQREVRLDPYTIVQLPRSAYREADATADESGVSLAAAEAAEATRQAERAADKRAERAAVTAEHAASSLAERTAAEAERASRAAVQQAELAAAVLRAELAETQLAEQRNLTRSLSTDKRKALELEAALSDRAAKLKDAETRASEHYVRAERLTHDLRKLEEELQRQRDRATRLAKELEDEKRTRSRVETDLGSARKSPELAQARERIAILEEALRAAEDIAKALQSRAVAAERALVETRQQLAALASEYAVFRAESEVPRVDAQAVERLAERAERAEARIAIMEAQLVEAGESQAQELASLEILLRQRGQAISILEQEILRRESIVRELIGAVEEARDASSFAPTAADSARSGEPEFDAAAVERAIDRANAQANKVIGDMRDHLTNVLAENADMRAKLDALALDVARREGELQTRTWRITELEEQLAAKASAPPPPPPLVLPGADVLAMRGQLDALRQALKQEHDARVRAESGEELAHARDELARQAVLLEQLGRELDARDHARSTGQAHEETQG